MLPVLVEFDQDNHATEWQRGVSTSGQIILPEELEQVATIRIERMSIRGL